MGNQKIWLSLIESCAVFPLPALTSVSLSLSVGVASYLCVAPEGYWDPQGPDFSNCSSPWVNIISQKVTYVFVTARLSPFTPLFGCEFYFENSVLLHAALASSFVTFVDYSDILLHRSLFLAWGALSTAHSHCFLPGCVIQQSATAPNSQIVKTEDFPSPFYSLNRPIS